MTRRSDPPVVLSIAGTDSGGAAGLAADLATCAVLGAHGACVVTAVTAQDTTGVRAVHPVPVATIADQLDAVLDDLPVAVVKTGMLGTGEVVELIAHYARTRLRDVPIVVDPVLVATSGAVLGGAQVLDAYREVLAPLSTVFTPNPAEARALTGLAGEPGDAAVGSDMSALATAVTELGAACVLTGGPDVNTAADLSGDCIDWVATPGQEPVALTHPAVPTDNDHGTGCTFSTALAVELAHARALEPGAFPDLLAAARAAGDFTVRQLTRSQAWSLGRGRGPIAHTTGGIR